MASKGEHAAGTELVAETRRIAMRDVDAAGILYLAAPYEWQEEMWTGFLYEHGHPLSMLLADGVGGPVVASSATYSAPVTLDSILTCRLYVEAIGRTSFGLRMDARFSGGAPALSAATRHVWCKVRPSALEPVPLPGWLRELFAGETPDAAR